MLSPDKTRCSLLFLTASCALAVSCCTTNTATTPQPPHQPSFLKDPAEPVNRGIWAVNKAAMLGVVDPVSQTYRGIVPKPVRESIGNAGTNVLYPGRLINEVLQGRWHDAGDDTLRFLTNTTVGLGGLFDVASDWNMAEPRADFAETFQKWGWLPDTYIMLPLLGPSDQSSVFARAAQEATDPLNYFDGIRAANLTFSGHRLTERNDATVRLIRQEADSYSTSHLAWSYFGRRNAPDWSPKGNPHIPTLETINAAYPRFTDSDFPNSLRTSRVRIATTGKQLPFNYRMQPDESAPLAYVCPGLGSHRLSNITLEIAEHLYETGFSVVTISSSFHHEFMESAATSPLPGRLKHDAADIWNALSAIDASLERKFGQTIGKRVFVGASMGGYLGLSLATSPPQNSTLHIDRFLAINPPVDLFHGVQIIDEFQYAPEQWPSEHRQFLIDNTVHKLAALTNSPPQSLTAPPFCGVESKFLIGLNFRYTLRDVIYSAEKNHHLGLVSKPISSWNRKDAYREILCYSYTDYVSKIMIPYHLEHGGSNQEFAYNRTLANRTTALRNHPGLRVITNRNDFLLRPQDLSWLQSTFGNKKLTLLPSGGHLGNIASPEIRQAIKHHLGDLP